MHLLLLVLIYLAFISLVLPGSLLGSDWPMMHLAFFVLMAAMVYLTFKIAR